MECESERLKCFQSETQFGFNTNLPFNTESWALGNKAVFTASCNYLKTRLGVNK